MAMTRFINGLNDWPAITTVGGWVSSELMVNALQVLPPSVLLKNPPPIGHVPTYSVLEFRGSIATEPGKSKHHLGAFCVFAPAIWLQFAAPSVLLKIPM